MKKSVALLAFMLMGLGAFAQSAQAFHFSSDLLPVKDSVSGIGWDFRHGHIHIGTTFVYDKDRNRTRTSSITMIITGLTPPKGTDPLPKNVFLTINCSNPDAGARLGPIEIKWRTAVIKVPAPPRKH
ncbi:MAG: hypothetical protein ACE5EK_09580, partial [Nitrospinales bacterium]